MELTAMVEEGDESLVLITGKMPNHQQLPSTLTEFAGREVTLSLRFNYDGSNGSHSGTLDLYDTATGATRFGPVKLSKDTVEILGQYKAGQEVNIFGSQTRELRR